MKKLLLYAILMIGATHAMERMGGMQITPEEAKRQLAAIDPVEEARNDAIAKKKMSDAAYLIYLSLKQDREKTLREVAMQPKVILTPVTKPAAAGSATKEKSPVTKALVETNPDQRAREVLGDAAYLVYKALQKDAQEKLDIVPTQAKQKIILKPVAKPVAIPK